MKNRKFFAILMAVWMVIAGGCGKQIETNNPAEDTAIESTKDIEENAAETVEDESFNVDKAQEFDPAITEKEDSELNLKDYHDYLEDKTLLTNDDVFADGEFEFADNIYYQTTEKIPMYASNGVRTGYIKEDVNFSVIAVCEDWCYFYLGSGDKRYARLSGIEANSLGPEEPDAISSERIAEEMAKAQPQTVAPAEQNPVQETVPNTTVEEPEEVPAESDKYTPEEAIAVYRGLMETGGMTWDPSLKDVSSWGTGFIYIDKGYPEWAAQSDLESFAYGDGTKHFIGRYYLEVTDFDDSCVYVTEWHN